MYECSAPIKASGAVRGRGKANEQLIRAIYAHTVGTGNTRGLAIANTLQLAGKAWHFVNKISLNPHKMP